MAGRETEARLANSRNSCLERRRVVVRFGLIPNVWSPVEQVYGGAESNVWPEGLMLNR